MNDQITQISTAARQAVRQRNWTTVRLCAGRILQLDPASAEGYFLAGLAEKAMGANEASAQNFEQALNLDASRYDAAIELAARFAVLSRQGDACALLTRYESHLGNSPLYLNMAGDTYTRIGLHLEAWPLYLKARELQPEVEVFDANLAACAVLLGRIDEAKRIYERLLARHPEHQGNHYELARLERARDTRHVDQMEAMLERARRPPEENIYLYYALGKELEDLERWEEAFTYYKRAGDAARSVSPYNVADDVRLIDKVIEVCDSQWLESGAAQSASESTTVTPVFVVGLPRSGTTLTERILSSHSRVGSVDETFFAEVAIRRSCGAPPAGSMTPEIITRAAASDPGLIAKEYLRAVRYKLGGEPHFIDKLPENFTWLGFIARAFPGARLLHVRRSPMDVCFAMYKQPYFRYAYTLEDLATYYIAFDRLRNHWRDLLGARLVELDYEALTTDLEETTRWMLERLDLPFEAACLEFDRNERPSATASSVQVREQVHTRSVLNWKHFERELEPLKQRLEQAGITVE